MRSAAINMIGGLLASSAIAAMIFACPVLGAPEASKAAPIDGARVPGPAVVGAPLAITHVTVLSMAGDDAPVKDATVIIRAGKIEKIGSSAATSVPAGVRQIDGRGKFLMPGLTDMHVHPENDRMIRLLSGMRELPAGTYDTSDVYLPYVANGVLQILDMSAMSEAVGQRAEIESGRALGPHIGLAAMLDGAPTIFPPGISHGAATPEDGRQAVRDLKADGFDFIKTYSRLNLDTFTAVVDEAAHQGMKALGHIPGRMQGMTQSYFQPNYTMVAHAEEFAFQGTPATQGTFCTDRGCTASDADIPRFVQMTKKNGSWLESTLTLDDRLLESMKSADWAKGRGEFQFVNPVTLMAWKAQNSHSPLPPERIARQEKVVDLSRKIVKVFSDAGIPVLPGTDTGIAGVVPGFALHDELEALARAGLSNQQILIADTRLAAEWLGVDADRGTIQPGKRADLLLLDANPLEDVANTRKISAVLMSGRYLSRADIDAKMQALSKKYAAMKVHLPAAGPVPGHWDSFLDND